MRFETSLTFWKNSSINESITQGPPTIETTHRYQTEHIVSVTLCLATATVVFTLAETVLITLLIALTMKPSKPVKLVHLYLITSKRTTLLTYLVIIRSLDY